ncbi:hypothetical protein ENBRE01_1999, partial [Enteropsectra breve]
RIDLVFNLKNIEGAVKILLSRSSIDKILAEVLKTGDIALIKRVYKLCQKDYAQIVEYCEKSANKQMDISEYVGERYVKLYCMAVKNGTDITDFAVEFDEKGNFIYDNDLTDIISYAKKNQLLDLLVSLQLFNLTSYNVYRAAAKHYEEVEQFFLLVNAAECSYNAGVVSVPEIKNLLNTGIEHCLYDGVMNYLHELQRDKKISFIMSTISYEEYVNKLLEKLNANDRFGDMGLIYEAYLQCTGKAVEYYLKDDMYCKALKIYRRIQDGAENDIAWSSDDALNAEDDILNSADTNENENSINGENSININMNGDINGENSINMNGDMGGLNRSVMSMSLGKEKMSMEAMEKMLVEGAIEGTRKYTFELNKLKASYEKYKQRIGTVRERINENVGMSQTSFSYSSLKSARKALLRDRPGGAYENEYVLNKIREIVKEINYTRNVFQEIIEIFVEFNKNEFIRMIEDEVHEMRDNLRDEVDRLWEFKRADYDANRPVIPKPELSDRYFK